MNRIILLLFLFLGCNLSLNAQNFEGIIKMHQETANELEYDVIWYIKKDKIALEISSDAARGSSMRFVLYRDQKSILMITGETKKEISIDQINPLYDFNNIKTVKESTTTSSLFDEIFNYTVSTNEIIANVEVAAAIDINFSEYANFFKNDCGIYLLASSGQTGFPINSTIQDKDGNLIVKNTLTSVEEIKISDSKFQ